MGIAALYDIHGNLAALESVLKELSQWPVEQLVVGGDVLPGPQPGDCLSALQECRWTVQCLSGNGERDVLTLLSGGKPHAPQQFWDVLKWTAAQLSPDQIEWIRGWPKSISMTLAGLDNVLFCHATPDSMDAVFTERTPESRLARTFGSVDAKLIVCGHTHMQFDRWVGTKRILNAGSVGMNYGKAGAAWLWIDDLPEMRITSYDSVAAGQKISASGFPGASQFVENHVLNCPTRDSMLNLFEQAAEKYFPDIYT